MKKRQKTFHNKKERQPKKNNFESTFFRSNSTQNTATESCLLLHFGAPLALRASHHLYPHLIIIFSIRHTINSFDFFNILFETAPPTSNFIFPPWSHNKTFDSKQHLIVFVLPNSFSKTIRYGASSDGIAGGKRTEKTTWGWDRNKQQLFSRRGFLGGGGATLERVFFFFWSRKKKPPLLHFPPSPFTFSLSSTTTRAPLTIIKKCKKLFSWSIIEKSNLVTSF